MARPNTVLLVARNVAATYGSYTETGQNAGLLYSNQALDGSENDGSTILQNYGLDMSTGWWNPVNGSWTSGVTSPSGASNAATMVENSSTAAHFTVLGHTFTTTVTAGGNVTVSIYAKMAGRRYLIIRMGDGADANGFAASFDLQTGAATGTTQNIGNGSYASASVAPGQNSFYKCSVRGIISTSAVTSFTLWWAMNSADTVSPGQNYAGDGTSGMTLWRPKVVLS